MVHLVGLGGGGCNVLEYAIKQGFEATYTFVTSPERTNIPQGAQFIDFTSPDYYYSDSIWYKEDIVLPEPLRRKLMKYTDNIIVVCIGGYAGTMLLKAILNYNWPEILNFRFIVGTPMNFERREQKNIIRLIKILDMHGKIQIVPLEKICKTEGNNFSIDQAFQLADSLMFSKI